MEQVGASKDAATVAVPSGTVTFLFTDIEGSTQRWERNQHAMQAAVRLHDTLVRSAILAHAGYVFKTVGDAFCCAFGRPQDAVAGALGLQRALAAQDFAAVDGLRVRAALHTGTADERDGDYFGPAVNRVARLLAIAHGGQTIASEVTHELAQVALPPQAAFIDLGVHQLKDLSRSEHVFGLTAPGLQADFPPLRSVTARRHNLPAELTSFIGRELEVTEVEALLEQHRLVTLVGAGGIGKTRISLRVAAGAIDAFSDGVWFVELAPVDDPSHIASTIGTVVRATLPAHGDIVEALVAALATKNLLLVFDNCEHLIDAVAHVSAALLRGAPKLRILASSRQSFGVAGEAAYRVPSLDVPTDAEVTKLDAATALTFGAVALFASRAVSAQQHFTLTDQNAPIVADIVRRLDGIALAIELAASRVKILNVRQLNERLDERFRLLTRGSRDALPRQQTLRALIDWSYDLLGEPERLLFARTSVFVDGFTVEAAIAVCSDDELDEFELFDVLASLVDKSLVAVEFTADSTRYKLLESTRAYALEKLALAGETDVIKARHLAWIEALAAAAESRLSQTLQRDALDGLRIEVGNIRAALAWARACGAVDSGAAIVANVAERASKDFGSITEWIAQVRYFSAALPPDRVCALAKLYWADCLIIGNSGRFRDSLQAAQESVRLARICGDDVVIARSVILLAGALVRLNRNAEARVLLAEVESSGTQHSSPLRFANYYVARGIIDARDGNAAGAIRCYEHVVAKYRELGVTMNEGTVVMNLAELEHARGHTKRAIEIARDALRALTSPYDRCSLLCNLAGYLLAVDATYEARRAAETSFEIFESQRPGSAAGVIALEHLTLAIALGGDLPRAAHLAGYIAARFSEAGLERDHTERVTHDRLTRLLSDGLAPADLARFQSAGRTLTPDGARAQIEADRADESALSA